MILKAGLTLSLLPFVSLQALDTAPHDQEPGCLFSPTACCPSLPIFWSSDADPFAIPLIYLHPPAQGLSFCFFSELKMFFPQMPIWLLKGELSFDLPVSTWTLQSVPLPAFSSLTTDFNAYHYSFYVICASSPKIKDWWGEGPLS